MSTFCTYWKHVLSSPVSSPERIWMSNTIKFIDTVIKNLKPKDSRTVYWCDGCPSFGIRVMPSGVKSFVFKYMVRNHSGLRTSRWITIGKYPEWTIRKARQEYDKLYEQVHSYGRDPVKEKKEEEKKKKEKERAREAVRKKQ